MPTTTTEPVREGARDEGALIRRVLPLPAIIRATLAVTGISFEQLANTGRSPAVVSAKRVIAHLARAHTHASFPEIGRALGKTSHTGARESFLEFGLAADKPWSRATTETLAELAVRAYAVAVVVAVEERANEQKRQAPSAAVVAMMEGVG